MTRLDELSAIASARLSDVLDTLGVAEPRGERVFSARSKDGHEVPIPLDVVVKCVVSSTLTALEKQGQPEG